MHRSEPEVTYAARLRRQKNLFSTIAVCALAATGLALPRKVANYRELKAVNAHLLELQRSIVRTQQQIIDTQNQLTIIQKDIAYWQAQ